MRAHQDDGGVRDLERLRLVREGSRLLALDGPGLGGGARRPRGVHVLAPVRVLLPEGRARLRVRLQLVLQTNQVRFTGCVFQAQEMAPWRLDAANGGQSDLWSCFACPGGVVVLASQKQTLDQENVCSTAQNVGMWKIFESVSDTGPWCLQHRLGQHPAQRPLVRGAVPPHWKLRRTGFVVKALFAGK